mgnify:CR=1 FL=1
MLGARRRKRRARTNKVSEIIEMLDSFLKKPPSTVYIETCSRNDVTLSGPTLEINVSNLSKDDEEKLIDYLGYLNSKSSRVMSLTDLYTRLPRLIAFIFEMYKLSGIDREEAMSTLKMLGINVEDGEDELEKRIPNSDNLSLVWTKYIVAESIKKAITIRAFDTIRISAPP